MHFCCLHRSISTIILKHTQTHTHMLCPFPFFPLYNVKRVKIHSKTHCFRFSISMKTDTVDNSLRSCADTPFRMIFGICRLITYWVCAYINFSPLLVVGPFRWFMMCFGSRFFCCCCYYLLSRAFFSCLIQSFVWYLKAMPNKPTYVNAWCNFLTHPLCLFLFSSFFCIYIVYFLPKQNDSLNYW